MSTNAAMTVPQFRCMQCPLWKEYARRLHLQVPSARQVKPGPVELTPVAEAIPTQSSPGSRWARGGWDHSRGAYVLGAAYFIPRGYGGSGRHRLDQLGCQSRRL